MIENENDIIPGVEIRTNGSFTFRENKKNKKSVQAIENNTRKFKDKYEIVTKTCFQCGYENFPKYKKCKLCKCSLEDEEESKIVFFDVERANGPST